MCWHLNQHRKLSGYTGYTLANSFQTYSSSCIFKCLWAELFLQLHIVALTPVLCNCWTLIDVCEKSIFGRQSRALSCTCKANTQGCHPGLDSESCSCKGSSTFGSEQNSFWPKYRQCTSMERGLQWARAKASPGQSQSLPSGNLIFLKHLP